MTGLAGGFGYNRTLVLPSQDKVHEFPLVAGLKDSSAIGGKNAKPKDALAKLAASVPPKLGEYFIAAGAQFTSFKLIDTQAILAIEFGRDFLVAILGVSTLRHPKVAKPYVSAVVDLEAVFKPGEGEIKATAILAPGSYVIDEAAKLTGGIAFAAWFGNSEHAGDFVLTIGGYHSAFKVPAHYPAVPRLGLNWKVDDEVLIFGEAYFAICPAAMMAGGRLALTYDGGNLQAWLKAQIDVILFWKPFYLLADASLSIGVSYRLSVLGLEKTISAEFSVDFHFWGPPIGGTVHVDWYIISFTVKFGKDRDDDASTSIDWDEFKTMLPAAESKKALAPSAGDPRYIVINPVRGMQCVVTKDDLTFWIVRPDEFEFSISSAIPALTLKVPNGEGSGKSADFSAAGKAFNIRSVKGGVDTKSLQSDQSVTLTDVSGREAVDILRNLRAQLADDGGSAEIDGKICQLDHWTIKTIETNGPAALWGPPIPKGQSPSVNPISLLVPVTAGLSFAVKPAEPANPTTKVVIDEAFPDRIVNPGAELGLAISSTQRLREKRAEPAETFAAIATIEASEVAARRERSILILKALNVAGLNDDPKPKLAGAPEKYFVDEPLLYMRVAA